MKLLPAISTCVGLAITSPLPAQVSHSENFESMGTSGTQAPTGWSFYGWPDGDNSTWTTSISVSGIGGGTANPELSAVTAPSTESSATQGYNLGSGASPSDRALGTAPTGFKGTSLQWTITNNGVAAIHSIRIGYEIRRLTEAAIANELPGYWLFYSLDSGGTWTNVSTLNPTLEGPGGVVVGTTTGTTSIAPTEVSLGNPWNPGAALLLRWVDDNASQSSPDQIIGLDNVTLESSDVAPAVSLVSPLITDSFVAPATILIEANASDAGGTIAKVEFLQGSTLLGESTSAPYQYTWPNVPQGTYSLTARATDNNGNITISNAVEVPVNTTPGSGSLTREAYLQQAGATTMTIRWRSSQRIAGRVSFGASPVSLSSSVNEPFTATDHEVTLTGLVPDTTYFYNIGSATDTLAGGDAAHTFKTPPVPGSAPGTRIWVLGDAGTGDANQASVRDAFYTWTASRDPDLVLQLGDNAYEEGTDSEFQEKVFDVYGDLMKRVPFWSCLGNHETADQTAFVDTYPYFGMFTYPKAGECGGVPSGTEHYYSFDYGNIHFISLDSTTADRSPTGAMADWLTNDLAANTRTWIICFFHHPPYTRGTFLDSDTDETLLQMRENLLPILEAGGVDLVVTGHSHTYERSYLLDGHYGTAATLTPSMKKNPGDGRAAGDGAYIKPLTGPRDHFGTVYAVAGSAGKTGGGWLNHPAHTVSLSELGSLVLDVNGNRLDATFVRPGNILTDFTIIKQGAADGDRDGIPDEYEIANGLDRFNAADALLDNDGDGTTNRAEYLFGLLAATPDRYGWTTTRNPATGHVEVGFPTLAGRTYQVEWSPSLLDWFGGSGEITGDGGTKTWTDDSGEPKRFYRVRVTGSP